MRESKQVTFEVCWPKDKPMEVRGDGQALVALLGQAFDAGVMAERMIWQDYLFNHSATPNRPLEIAAVPAAGHKEFETWFRERTVKE